MNVQIPKKVLDLFKMFEKNNFQIYIVGGAVRDILLGKIVYDWDFTTDATPDNMLKILKKMDAYYTNEFGTVGIPTQEDKRPLEITTFRTEHGYSDSRRPDKVKWGKSLKRDLERRDFTVNAMALGKRKNAKSKYLKKWEDKTADFLLSATPSFILIDPHDGRKDLDNKLIRAVGDPKKRFGEDALRMMRAVRIASELKFGIEEKTLKAIKNNASLIEKISNERIRDELLKTLASPYPYQGMTIMRNVGLMREVLPEMEEAFGVEQKSPGRHHIYDVGTHSMLSLKHVAEKNKDPIVRFATLIHDIGKPETYKKLKNGTITFYNHEVVSGRIAKKIAKRLKFSKKQTEKFYKLVRFHQFTLDEKQTDSAIRRFIGKVGKENVPDMLDLRVGDRLGGGARETSWRLEEFKKRLVEVQKQPFTVHDIKVSGNDVMKILDLEAGPRVGEVLKKLYNEVVEKKVPNNKKELIKRLKEMK
ncbi:MAG: HD domain-containing protein [Candidatus Woesebacteria bacterium]